MHPNLILYIITVLFGSLTIGTIINIYLIDVCYAKEQYRKARGQTILIWVVLVGTGFNIPLWYACYQTVSQ